jgi:hypothetical protein
MGGASTTAGGSGAAGASSGASGAASSRDAEPPSGDSSGVGPPGDFAARCAAPGVVRCFGFDDEATVKPHLDPAADTMYHGTVDATVKASGNGSLKFEVPAMSPANTSGEFWLDFADDFSVQFGEKEEFYVQWRQRFSPEFLTTKFVGGEGWKQVIIGEGSRPGHTAYSCTDIEVVTIDPYQRGFPGMYHSCGAKDGQYEGFEPPIPPDDFAIENAIAGCTYHNQKVPPCFGYKPDQWMTFQVHIKIGTWYKNDHVYHHDSTIQLWGGYEGSPAEPVIDLSPGDAACAAQQVSQPGCHTGYDLFNDKPEVKYGKVWLLPYNTDKDGTATNPVSYTWYDELIISRNRIADPAP